MGLTQQELAEDTNLSLRIIQRVESGKTVPKGYTLKALSEALNIKPNQLVQQGKSDADSIKLKIKLINLSALAFIGIPFGNIILPMILWQKDRKIASIIDNAGRQIISFQILWSTVLCVLLTVSPFIQVFVELRFPLILFVLFLGIGINLIFIGRSAFKINKGNFKVFCLSVNLL